MFYTGLGWNDRQLADGTIVLIAPTGPIYRTEPHGASMFSRACWTDRRTRHPAGLEMPDTDRSAMMPRRKQTRDQDRRDRISAERRQRVGTIADEEPRRQAWLAANYEPPPF